MKRIVFAAAAAAMLATAPGWADDKPSSSAEVDNGRLKEAASLSEYTRKSAEFSRKYLAAKPDQRKELLKERPDVAPYRDKAAKLVEKDATDSAAFTAIMFIVQRTPRPDVKYYQLLAKHHAARPELGSMMMGLSRSAFGRTEAGQKFFKAVLDTNPNRLAKGMACYALGSAAHQQTETNPAKAAEAEKYLARVEKEFGDLEYGKSRAGNSLTLDRLVKGALFQIRNLGIGMKAPTVKSHDLDGKDTTLASLKGKVVVLDFWATWCGPCKAMIPHSRELTEKLKDKPFVLISVSSDAKKRALTDFLEKEKMPWTHWWEGNGDNSLHNVWGVTGIPTVYVVDAKGVIRYKGVGYSEDRMEKLDKIVEELIKEAESK